MSRYAECHLGYGDTSELIRATLVWSVKRRRPLQEHLDRN